MFGVNMQNIQHLLNGAQAPGMPQAPAVPRSSLGLGGGLGKFFNYAQDNPAAMMALGSRMMAGQTPKGIHEFGQLHAAQKGRNGTLRYLRENHPELAEAVAAGLPIRDAYALSQGSQAGLPEYGLNPQYGVDENDNPVLIQMSKDGKAVQTQLPDNVALRKKPIEIKTGTHTILLDPITRQPIGQFKNENYQKAFDTASGTEAGKARSEAEFNLGGALQKADQSIAQIDAMLNHPGRETATGLSATLDPRNYLGGTDATDFNVRKRQLEGQAFLEAFESLKGGGHITEIEGQKATEAMARLDTSQSEEAFKQSLLELRAILEAGKRRARARAGQSVSEPATIGGPDLKSKYGLE